MHNEKYTGYINDFKIINKTWGFEKILINTFLYCVKELNIYEGCSTSKHYHKFKHETFYLINGIANISIYNNKGEILETFTLNENESFCIEPNTPHSIENISFSKTLKILESSTEDKEEDNIRINYV